MMLYRLLELATWLLLGLMIVLQAQAALAGDTRAMLAWAVAASATVIALGVSRAWR